MTTFLVAKNNASSKLAAAITAGATSLTVATGEGARFPSTFPFHITIGSEILKVTNRSGDVFTVVRAQEATVAAVHAINTIVRLNITAQAVTELQQAINAAEDVIDTAEEDIDTLEGNLATHAGNASAHHTRYADSEAVNAMGAKATSNPLNHDRYTDAEAVIAAKTVNLDDLATPDDNTDLNASTSKHGLCPKAPNDITKFLRGDMAWADIPITGGFAVITSGSYTGDGSDNRAIPHGLGTTPKIVIVQCTSGSYEKISFLLTTATKWVCTYSNYKSDAVTAMNATNFYVDYDSNDAGVNYSGRTYLWIAIS